MHTKVVYQHHAVAPSSVFRHFVKEVTIGAGVDRHVYSMQSDHDPVHINSGRDGYGLE